MSESSISSLSAQCGLAAINLTDAQRPCLDEGEEVAACFDSVLLFLGVEDQGAGQLCITTRKVVWVRASGGAAYGVSFPSLIMHAVASASEAFPHDSIYIQSENAEPSDAHDAAPEVRLVPSDDSAVPAIFQALCDGAAANPDSDVDDDEGDFFFDQDEVAQGAAEADDGRHSNMVDRFSAMLQTPSNGGLPQHQQFEDADSSSD